MPEFIELAKILGPILTFALLVILTIERLTKEGMFGLRIGNGKEKKRAEESEADPDEYKPPWGQTVIDQMQKLTDHFNHDTTNQNNEIITLLKEIHKSQEKMGNDIQNIKNYGVKILKN